MACQDLVIKTCKRKYLDSWPCMLRIINLHRIGWILRRIRYQIQMLGSVLKAHLQAHKRAERGDSRWEIPNHTFPTVPMPLTEVIIPSGAHLHMVRAAESPKGRQKLRLRTQREGQPVGAFPGLFQKCYQDKSMLDQSFWTEGRCCLRHSTQYVIQRKRIWGLIRIYYREIEG